MPSFINIFCITLLTVCCRLEAKYVPGVSYIDNVVLYYNNVSGIWTCDRRTYPSGTFGCQIWRLNTPNIANELMCTNVCFDSDRNIKGLILTYTQTMLNPKTVYVFVESYAGAKSVWTSDYSLSLQSINGTIAPGDWPEVQEIVRANMKDVDESSGQ
ncbi:uncharacterized protein LOC105665197 [Ceratitis capitata]|uniref:Uncharacterized protein n=2 Tax=Ceratitis capitata TaxID=7213 RepID=W8CC02_CERCA|nr:uncharacterized protein LOC105665197 [Ceratitis capitata]